MPWYTGFEQWNGNSVPEDCTSFMTIAYKFPHLLAKWTFWEKVEQVKRHKNRLKPLRTMASTWTWYQSITKQGTLDSARGSQRPDEDSPDFILGDH
ncbi:hypothetical protein DUI87_28633 [Hirundo rustica rustica]|uniref:Uncharacterized protein n=1 Tax=Hirundo rustica rustica TaxID=333673 RepID=A0A3M0J3D5_HIRRU|nr:hypothetical protein DUI87_28633 [Hirundo rustica rustica]